METLADALLYVRRTGFVPWGDEREKDFTEKMHRDELIYFQMPTATFQRYRRQFRWSRFTESGRYFLTKKGRQQLKGVLSPTLQQQEGE